LIGFELTGGAPLRVQGCGFSDPRFSLSRWPIPIRPFFARGPALSFFPAALYW
jgi:hypothetical protein